MKLSKEQEAEIFRALLTEPITAVGYKFGLDKVYSNVNSIRNTVLRVRARVKQDPSAYGISDEVVQMVEKAMNDRMVNRKPGGVPMAVQTKIEATDIVGRMTSVRDKAWSLIDKKLDMLAKSPKKLREIQFGQLGTLGGIAFDKVQILRGEATSHIALKAKVEQNLTPEQLMQVVLKQREEVNEINNK